MFYLFGSLLFAFAGTSALASMTHDVARHRRAMIAALRGLSSQGLPVPQRAAAVRTCPAPALARATAG